MYSPVVPSMVARNCAASVPPIGLSTELNKPDSLRPCRRMAGANGASLRGAFKAGAILADGISQTPGGRTTITGGSLRSLIEQFTIDRTHPGQRHDVEAKFHVDQDILYLTE